MTREQVDATKGMFRKKREKLQKFEYKLVQSETAEPVAPKVLPKVPLAKYLIPVPYRYRCTFIFILSSVSCLNRVAVLAPYFYRNRDPETVL